MITVAMRKVMHEIHSREKKVQIAKKHNNCLITLTGKLVK